MNYFSCNINLFLKQIHYIIHLMGNYRDKPQKTKETQVFRGDKLSYTVSSMCGWRMFMEDAHIAQYPFANHEGVGLFGIFDGHGGAQCSTFVANHFSKTLAQNGYFITGNYEKALTETFIKMDELMKTKSGQNELLEIREENVQKNNSNNYVGDSVAGTTALVCLVTKDYVYVANAGDSRAIGSSRIGKGSKGKLKELSFDHKPSDEHEKKRILKAGGVISEEGRINNNLNLTRALGDFTYKSNKNLPVQQQIISAVPEITKTSRKQLSFIIMGCDGIWQSKSNQKMIKWVQKKMESKNMTMRKLAETLLDEELAANQNEENGMDNMTVMILNL